MRQVTVSAAPAGLERLIVKSIRFPPTELTGFAVATCEKPCDVGLGTTTSVSVTERFGAPGSVILMLLVLCDVTVRTALTLNVNASWVFTIGNTAVACDSERNAGSPVTVYFCAGGRMSTWPTDAGCVLTVMTLL